MNGFDPRLKFSSWAYRIVHNETISYLRKSKYERKAVELDSEEVVDVMDLLKSDSNVEEETDKKYLAENISKIVDGLDEKYKDVIILKYMEDKDYEEISDIIKKPKGTVATLLTGMTDELNAPVVVSCQIGKETDRRENRRPMLSDLKDAGAIGEKAIKVFLLYRSAFYNLETLVAGNGKSAAKPEIGEVIIAKGGPPIIVPHYFDGTCYLWRDKDD